MSNARELAELGGSYGTGGFVGMKNRIINGGMTISQRGTSSTTNSGYLLDRWNYSISAPSSLTVSQSSTAPAGFLNSLLVTITTGGSIASTLNYISQAIEGLNCADLGFGTSSAKTVTISFWVRSSVTGTYGGSLRNYGPASYYRGYPFTYTINAANTWEYKTVTIAGDGVGGAGQWNTNNNGSLTVFFDLGTQSGYLGTVDTWNTGNVIGTTGTQTTLVATNGATWYVTGVQLEVGSTATAFDFRSYGQELLLCQRYYELIFADAAGEAIFSAPWQTSYRWAWQMKVQKRTNCSFGLLGSGNWQVATPNINGGTTNVGAYHASSTYYLQGTPNTAVASASSEL